MNSEGKPQHGEAGEHSPTSERHSIAVDVVMLSIYQRELRVLVIRRRYGPYQRFWGLPGGFVELDESLDNAAERVLFAQTKLSGMFLEQLYTFGDPTRDRRGRVISVVYYALVNWSRVVNLETNENVTLARIEVPWQGEMGGSIRLFGQNEELACAFDHEQIIGMAVKRIRGKLDYAPIGFQLLPKKFTLRQLQEIHETVLNRSLNKDSFRRRMIATGLLRATGEREEKVGHRPAELYRFSKPSAI